MASPVDSSSTVSQITNTPASQPKPRGDPAQTEESRTPEPPARRENPDPDSNIGNNIDTSA